MKYLVLLCVAIGLAACTKKASPDAVQTQEINENINKEYTNQNGEKRLLGVVNKQGLEKDPYASWFNKGLNYRVDDSIAEQLKKSLKNYNVEVFFGTWCGDSKREVPHLYNVLDAAEVDWENVKVIGVDSDQSLYKKSPNGEEKGKNIHRVPTIIFYKNGEEKGRIVESPVESLEKDMLAITTGKDYVEHYHVVSDIHRLIKTKGFNTVSSRLPALADLYRDMVKNQYELNTYARTFLYDNDEKGLVILKLNHLISPNNIYTLEQLVNGYNKFKKYNKAKLEIEGFLKKNAGNKDAESMLKRVNYFLEKQM